MLCRELKSKNEKMLRTRECAEHIDGQLNILYIFGCSDSTLYEIFTVCNEGGI